MTILRQRMLDDMRVRNLAPKTRDAYICQVARFAAYFSPDLLTPERVRSDLVTFPQNLGLHVRPKKSLGDRSS